jgi:glycosyltransferase involved in cell wall biosynthesis
MQPNRAGVRVLHVLAPAKQGGLESVVAMLSEGQRPGSHVAAVISPADAEGHPFVNKLRSAGVTVTVITAGGREYLREYRMLRDEATRIRPDIIHTHGYRPDVIGGAVARSLNVRHVSTVHGFTGGRLKNRLNETVQRFALRFADAVIAVSRPLVDRLTRSGIPPTKIFFIANGFGPSGSLLNRTDARRAMGLDASATVVGWLGRLSAEKGPDVMLSAFALAHRHTRLSMIGEGREENALRQQARDLGITDRVHWHGALRDAGRVLPAFDAFVLSSRTEGTPIALLEAMYAKVPIVATSVGGVPDVVSSDTALLVPPEQIDAIGAAINNVADDPSSAARRAEAAYERVVTAFSAASWLESVDAVYRSVAS